MQSIRGLTERSALADDPTLGGIPLVVPSEFTEMAKDGHVTDGNVVESDDDGEDEDSERFCEMRATSGSDGHCHEQAEEVDSECPHGE